MPIERSKNETVLEVNASPAAVAGVAIEALVRSATVFQVLAQMAQRMADPLQQMAFNQAEATCLQAINGAAEVMDYDGKVALQQQVDAASKAITEEIAAIAGRVVDDPAEIAEAKAGLAALRQTPDGTV